MSEVKTFRAPISTFLYAQVIAFSICFSLTSLAQNKRDEKDEDNEVNRCNKGRWLAVQSQILNGAFLTRVI